MRILLVSTYELGHQPLHVASPAGALLRAGYDVRCTDLSVEPLEVEVIETADAVACSVPMHTAARLAVECCRQIRNIRADVPLCLYGLYANLAMDSIDEGLADVSIAGEYESRLLSWAGDVARGPNRRPASSEVFVELGRGRFGLPARHLLPPLARYARLSVSGERRLAGYVEASHGCAHRCRHCPVPVVYDGRTRLVGVDALLADIGQLVDLGARHVTFGDPDFLNGPHHAARVTGAVHSAFPDLTFDVTAKVEHVVEHPEIWSRLRSQGCLFVVCAFESTNDEILERLQKGHTASQARDAVRILRAAGIEPRPSFLPFTPWSKPSDMADLFDLLVECDLVGNVDPVQFAIRLLVPPGSLLLASGALDGIVGPYDREHLSWTWAAADPGLDDLARRLADLAQSTASEELSAWDSYETMRGEVFTSLGLGERPRPEVDPRMRSAQPSDERPRLTEAWFCCAEPTEVQMGVARRPEPAVASG